MTFIWIAIFGALGCLSRYGMTRLVQTVWGTGFPLATMLINIAGALMMGFLFVETLERLTLSPSLRTGILTGFLGGFTTFSTYALEALTLAEQGEGGRALLYVGLSNGLGILAAFFGAFMARSI